MMEEQKNTNKTSLIKTIISVASAFIGIQTEQNRQRDFAQGKFSHFAIGAVIGVVVFISLLIVIVNLVLPN